MNRILFVLAPSDIEAQNATSAVPDEEGYLTVDAKLAGLLPILSYVLEDRMLKAHSDTMMLGVYKPELPRNARFNLFNLVGDADASRNMLRNIQALEARLKPIRCFNRPVDVFKTSRASLPKTLDNIPGCQVPRVESADPASFEELEAACTRFGRWPMIVRARGYHAGEHMELVANQSQLETMKDRSWLYEGVHLIEFVEFKNDHGLYQKNRVVMVDGTPYVRHAIFSDQWAIHSGSRADLMAVDDQLCRQEEKFLVHMRDSGLARYEGVFREIYQRIGLDVFGIDFALVDDRIVIFEANPCMNFLDQTYGDNNRYRYLESHIKVLRRAIKKMLARA